MKLSFTKMQGCANDYIYLDCRTSGVPENIAALSERLSRRHFSIGADGIICICAPVTAGADAMMRIFNADGSEGKMCGNGIRCVAEWLYTHGVAKPKLAIDTLSGLKTVPRMGEGLRQVEMGAYTAMAAALPAVNMGEGSLVDKALTVEAITALRAKCRAANVDYCVLKNTLVKRALENKGIKIDDAILEGPNAFVFGNGDPVSAPKLIKEFITAAEKDKKTSPLTIKAGIMDGAVQSVEEVKALADILPREQLIAKIMGCLNSQATALAYVIQAIADKKAEAGEQ